MSGTENVVRFCYTEKIKRLHYISTAYVAGKRRDVVYEDELDKGQAFNNNYEKSKFDAEKILDNLSDNMIFQQLFIGRALLWAIPGLVIQKITITFIFLARGFTASKITKRKKSPENDSSISPKRIHQSSYLRIPGDKHGAINLIPVDYAARTIVAISRRDESINKIFHIVNPSPPTLGELAEWMEVATGKRIKILPFYELQAQSYTIFEKLFLRVLKPFNHICLENLILIPQTPKHLLSGAGIECPLITQELIHRFIQYGVDTHWGKKNTTSGKEDRFLKIQEPLFSVTV